MENDVVVGMKGVFIAVYTRDAGLQNLKRKLCSGVLSSSARIRPHRRAADIGNDTRL